LLPDVDEESGVAGVLDVDEAAAAGSVFLGRIGCWIPG
jgi:hypothetical protein